MAYTSFTLARRKTMRNTKWCVRGSEWMIQARGGTHIWKWRTSATKHLRCRGLSVTNCIKKRGSFSDKGLKNRGSFSEMHQKIGAFRAKMVKNFSTFRQKCRNFRKIGGHWVKVGKNGGLLVKASKKKVGSFWWHMARNPKLSAPPPRGYKPVKL